MMGQTAPQAFHGYSDLDIFSNPSPFGVKKGTKHFIIQERKVSYRFYVHFHPFVGKLMQRLLQQSISGLQAADTEYVKRDGSFELLSDGKYKPIFYSDFFEEKYSPSDLVQLDKSNNDHAYCPVKDLDFTYSGAYSVYNWELFYHIPLIIAIHLKKNQRFEESRRWLHYLFDPTDDSDGPTPERFWKVRPFQYTDVENIEKILVNLVTNTDSTLRNDTIRSIEAWTNNPFRPHVIARIRQQSYMYKTVMTYLDNLIDWGDMLFRQDTGESIDEALNLYVLAANILGPRPLPVPKKGSVRAQTYANLRNDLEKFGTVLRDMEADIPFDLMPLPAEDIANDNRLATIRSLGKTLYFCVPQNEKLLGYWDTVADRLFKIRNSLNIKGTFRQLALFEPPIDPALLARAAAAGLDIAAIVNGLNQPLPFIRFRFLIQKAAEICQEVKSIGNNLLSAMEKEDGEAIAILRAKHERTILEMVENVKYSQLQEAIKSKEALIDSLTLAVQRYSYYERQLGKKADEIEKSIPELEELDVDSLNKMKFALKEPEMNLREIEIDIAQSLAQSGGKIISSYEADEIAKLKQARDCTQKAAIKETVGAGLSLLPSLGVDFEFWGMGGHMELGGPMLSRAMSFWASFDKMEGDKLTYEAGSSSKIGGYARREQDWAFQSNQEAGKITQIFKQLTAAQISVAIAEKELLNHQEKMKHAEDIELFLNAEGIERTGKKTNKAFYTWMKREIKGLLNQSFQFAFDIAKKSERALQTELGDPELNFIKFDYLAGKEGLLAGEKLHLDIKRMEMAYHEQNQREYELTKHVSLMQVNPLALLQLRMTGRCTVNLPEELFDLDGPGHYFRRIKSVALSIPCVTGPYTSVNCKLTLLKSSVRKSPVLNSSGLYQRENAEDNRFNDYFGSLQSVVTSSANNDSGLFETNLNDERYLPFENSGVISEWQLELPANPSANDPLQFDYETISDVILHIQYTAREGGGLLKDQSIDNLKNLINTAQTIGSVRLFSVRHEFPNEWAKFQSQIPETNQRFELKLDFRKEHYPFWSQGRLNSVKQIEILTKSTLEETPNSIDVFDKLNQGDEEEKSTSLVKDETGPFGKLLVGKLGGDDGIALPSNPIGEIKLYFDDRNLADIWITVTWGDNT